MTREDLREAAIKTITESPNIAIQAATGSGKSKVSLEALEALKVNNILIVVAERAHIQNWKDEFKKWNISFRKVEIICYASLKKKANTSYDAIIYDEAHHLNSTLRLDCISKINSKYNIFLSATLKDSLIYELQAIVGNIKTIKFNLQEAINSGVIAKPKIFLIPLELNNKDISELIVEEWGKKEKRLKATCLYKDRWTYLKSKKTIPNGSLSISCTQRQKYDFISEQFEYYKKRYMCCRNEALKNKWLQCGMKRKTYLGLLKTEIAKRLLSTLKDKRYICFCTSIVQAEYLGGDNAIHSKKKNCQEIIDKFNAKKLSNLYAVGMLQEGQNLADIQAGVIIQLDGEERTFIQKIGRVLRSDSPEQYIIYFKNTRDEEYLKNALENIDKKYIKVLDYEVYNR